jgi:hypothetical protein
MFVSTFLNVVFIPVLYVVVRTAIGGRARDEVSAAGTNS